MYRVVIESVHGVLTTVLETDEFAKASALATRLFEVVMQAGCADIRRVEIAATPSGAPIFACSAASRDRPEAVRAAR